VLDLGLAFIVGFLGGEALFGECCGAVTGDGAFDCVYSGRGAFEVCAKVAHFLGGGGWLESVWIFFCWCCFVGRAVTNVIKEGLVSCFCQVVGRTDCIDMESVKKYNLLERVYLLYVCGV